MDKTLDNTRLSTAITPSTLAKNKNKNSVDHEYNVEEIKDVIISTFKNLWHNYFTFVSCTDTELFRRQILACS